MPLLGKMADKPSVITQSHQTDIFIQHPIIWNQFIMSLIGIVVNYFQLRHLHHKSNSRRQVIKEFIVYKNLMMNALKALLALGSRLCKFPSMLLINSILTLVQGYIDFTSLITHWARQHRRATLTIHHVYQELISQYRLTHTINRKQVCQLQIYINEKHRRERLLINISHDIFISLLMVGCASLQLTIFAPMVTVPLVFLGAYSLLCQFNLNPLHLLCHFIPNLKNPYHQMSQSEIIRSLDKLHNKKTQTTNKKLSTHGSIHKKNN